MKLRHNITGDIVEVPPPNLEGDSVVIFNGRVVERVRYCDVTDTVTCDGGKVFYGQQWADYLVEQLKAGAWKVVN